MAPHLPLQRREDSMLLTSSQSGLFTAPSRSPRVSVMQVSRERRSVDNFVNASSHPAGHSSILADLDCQLQESAFDGGISAENGSYTLSNFGPPSHEVTPRGGHTKKRDKVHTLSEKMTELASQLSAEHDREVRHLLGKLKLCDQNRAAVKSELDKMREDMAMMSGSIDTLLRRRHHDEDMDPQGTGSQESMPMQICHSSPSCRPETQKQSGHAVFIRRFMKKIPSPSWRHRQKQERAVSPFDDIAGDVISPSGPERTPKSSSSMQPRRPGNNSLMVPCSDTLKGGKHQSLKSSNSMPVNPSKNMSSLEQILAAAASASAKVDRSREADAARNAGKAHAGGHAAGVACGASLQNASGPSKTAPTNGVTEDVKVDVCMQAAAESASSAKFNSSPPAVCVKEAAESASSANSSPPALCVKEAAESASATNSSPPAVCVKEPAESASSANSSPPAPCVREAADSASSANSSPPAPCAREAADSASSVTLHSPPAKPDQGDDAAGVSVAEEKATEDRDKLEMQNVCLPTLAPVQESNLYVPRSPGRAVGFFETESQSLADHQVKHQASDGSLDEEGGTSCVRFATDAPRQSTGSGASDGHVKFTILDVWTEPKQESHAAKLLRGAAMCSARFDQTISMTDVDAEDSGSEDECGDLKPKPWFSCKLVTSPNSLGRMWWDILAAVLVYYDCIAIPLGFLEIGDQGFVVIMTWMTRIFWSVDLPLSFLTGYITHDGRVVIDLWRVCKHYLRTWFFIDFMMVVIDWAQVVAGGFGGINAARMTKTLKSLRLVRVMRLLKMYRTKRLPEWLQALVDCYFSSEVSHIIFGILKIIVFLIWINHAIACLWYSMGNQTDKPSWLSEHDLVDASLSYRYATAFHWSLTQFTGAMEVVPHNLDERLYAVFVLLVAFILASIVVSSITSSMTRFEIATAQESKRLSLLKQYLFDNRISNKLAVRVQRNAQYAWMEQKRSTPESQIELLELISDPLRMELHYEINMRVIGVHPFFKQYSIINPLTCRQVCHVAVSMLKLSREDLLFDVGEIAQVPRMYFVQKGKLTYAPRQGNATKISIDQWACEPALWTDWIHCGTLRAKAECSLLVLLTEKFQDLANQAQGVISYPRKYGNAFVRCLNQCHAFDLTDVEDPTMELRMMAHMAANDELGSVQPRSAPRSRLPFVGSPVADLAFGACKSRETRDDGGSRMGFLRNQLTSTLENLVSGNRGGSQRSNPSVNLQALGGIQEEQDGVEEAIHNTAARFSNISCR